MHLLSSIALTTEEDILETSFCANDSHVAVALENGALNVLDTCGQLLYTLNSSDTVPRSRSNLAIADGKVIVADGQEKSVSIHDVATGYAVLLLPSYHLSAYPAVTLTLPTFATFSSGLPATLF